MPPYPWMGLLFGEPRPQEPTVTSDNALFRDVDVPPAAELHAVARWMLTDVHLGPNVPKHNAIRRAAYLLEQVAQLEYRPKRPDEIDG